MAEKAALDPELSEMPPLKVIVLPVLPLRLMPVPAPSVMEPLYVIVALLLLTTKSVPLGLVIELLVPAEKLPSTEVRDTPVEELFVLSISQNGREAVTMFRLTAGPPSTAMVATLPGTEI